MLFSGDVTESKQTEEQPTTVQSQTVDQTWQTGKAKFPSNKQSTATR